MVALAARVRRSGPASRATCADRLPPSPLAALAAMAPCRTAALGGHVSQCPACGAREERAHACTNRPGPPGRNGAAPRWLAPHRTLLLPVPSVLVTCPLPAALRPVARSHPSRLDTLRVQTAAAALHALALDPQYRGGQRGRVGVLHTWTRERASHPPRHALGPGGALAPDDSTWRPPRSAEWLVPVHALSTLFRGKVQAALTPTGLLAHVPPQVWTPGWMPHGQPAGTGTELLASCAPSLSRLALTTTRREKCADGSVTCRVTERTSPAWTHRTRPAEACMRRCLQHVRPKGCITGRSDGLLSPSRRPALAQLRTRLAACPSHDQAAQSGHTRDRPETARAPEAALHGPTCDGPLVFLCHL